MNLDIAFVLDSILKGFNVVNQTDNIPSYLCHNYNSCFEDDNLDKLRNLINSELTSGNCLCLKRVPHAFIV